MSDTNERPVASDGSVAGKPVAWGVLRVGGSWVSILANEVQAETSRKSFDKMENWVHEIVPLYLHPSPPLGDPEIAVEMLKDRVAELETAIRRLADQDATLSLLCKRDGSQVVTVTMDGTITDEEREAVEIAVEYVGSAFQVEHYAAVLRGLLERLR